MTTAITVSVPAGGRAVFTRRGIQGGQHATAIPGTIELPALTGDDYYQVTLRTGAGTAWAEAFAIRPEPGSHSLADLDRLPLGEAQAGGFALAGQVAALRSELDLLDDFVEHEVTARIGKVEWDVGQAFDAHLLGPVTWIPSSGRVEIPGYVPQPVARSYRLEMDIVLESHVSTGHLWMRLMNGDSQVFHNAFTSHVNTAGDDHRYRFQLDFNAPADADLHLTFSASLRNPSSGRAGYTRPQLTSPTVRSA